MSIGLNETGLSVRDFESVKEFLESRLIEEFNEIDLSPSSVFGQLIGVLSEPIYELWQQLERVYHAQYPTGANGISLDNVIQYNGIIRLPATRSQLTAVIFGDNSTLIPANTRFSTQETENVFFTTIDTTIDRNTVLQSEITVENVHDNHTYEVTINGSLIVYGSDNDATENEITNGLTDAINLALTSVIATDNLDGTLTITSADSETVFSVNVGSDLSLSKIGTPVLCESLDTGSISAPIGSLTKIDTPVFGLDSVTNLLSATLGRETETDQALRQRRLESLNIAGAGTLEAMYAKIFQGVSGIKELSITENDQIITDGNGRPPKSIEVTVSGGNDSDIAKAIWESKPGGIETYGNTNYTHIDTQGNNRLIYFTRPIEKYVHFNIDINLSSEEGFPANGIDLIKAAIIDYSSGYLIGQDLIIQKFYTPIYSIAGVSSASIQIAITDNPLDTPSYVSTNISIEGNEITRFDNSRINIVI